MSRTVNTTAGAVEYVTARIIERNGKSLQPVTFDVGLSPSKKVQPTWQAADAVELVGKGARVSMLVDGATTKGDFYLWVRANDTPEQLLLVCTNDVVSVV